MERNKVNIISLDFSKIFDTISPYRVLVKMKNLGISLKNIVRYFLKDRTMKVKIVNNYSQVRNRVK